MKVPKFYWSEAVLTSTCIMNRMPSRVLLFKTPKHALLKTYPHMNMLSELPFKLFGCIAYVYVQ